MNAMLKRTPLKQIGKKPPRCTECKRTFARERTGQKVCSIACGIEKAKRKRIERAVSPYRTKPKKPDNSLRHQLGLTQSAVNCYVRWRDRLNTCVTCDNTPGGASKYLTGSDIDAGHFLPRSVYPSIRFDTRQIFSQCVNCNRHNSGRRHEFRLFMIDLHGLELVEWFEAQNHPVKWDVDEVKEIRKHYRKLLRDEQRENA